MKFLLTSSGICNPSISDALVDLLGKPIAESTALFVPTGVYPFSGGGERAWKAIHGQAPIPLSQLGWKSLGLLELTALPTIREENWVPAVREADALLVWGGDVLYLTYWLRQSGLADLLPSLSDTVYVGVSAGSIAVTPYNCDAEFNLQFVPDGSDMAQGADRALGLVDFTLYPTSIIRTWRTPSCPTSRSGRPESRSRLTPSTTTPPSRWPMAPLTSSPKATGDSSTPDRDIPSAEPAPHRVGPQLTNTAIGRRDVGPIGPDKWDPNWPTEPPRRPDRS
jgi:dipeptidase E